MFVESKTGKKLESKGSSYESKTLMTQILRSFCLNGITRSISTSLLESSLEYTKKTNEFRPSMQEDLI